MKVTMYACNTITEILNDLKTGTLLCPVKQRRECKAMGVVTGDDEMCFGCRKVIVEIKELEG